MLAAEFPCTRVMVPVVPLLFAIEQTTVAAAPPAMHTLTASGMAAQVAIVSGQRAAATAVPPQPAAAVATAAVQVALLPFNISLKIYPNAPVIAPFANFPPPRTEPAPPSAACSTVLNAIAPGSLPGSSIASPRLETPPARK